MHVAVVGAGIMGAACACSLARRGHGVHLYDQFGFTAHKFGSSHGASRIIRKAYPDPFYTEIMAEAYGLWDELQAGWRKQIVHHVGLMMVGAESSSTMQDTIRSLRDLNVPFRVLLDVGEHLDWRLEPGEIGILTPEAGWVDADGAKSALLARAMTHGAKFMLGAVEDLDELEEDAVVVSCGSWVRQFAPLKVQPRVQTVAYLDRRSSGPVWIEDGDDFLYGFPSEPGKGTTKIGVHARGEPWNPGEERPGPDEQDLGSIREFSRRRYGAEGTIAETLTCLYTMTEDEDFRIGWLQPGRIVVSPCSGHGFKFAPWIGERVADYLEGKRDPSELPRFALDR
jgi:sarcosine oxidase